MDVLNKYWVINIWVYPTLIRMCMFVSINFESNSLPFLKGGIINTFPSVLLL